MSVFASDFIGETNLIAGTVVEVDEGVVTLTVGPATSVTGTAADVLGRGERATLSVRPESIRMTKTDAPVGVAAPAVGVRGQVREIVYLGSRVRVEVATADGVLAWVDLREDEAEGVETDDWVTMRWSVGAATVWAGQVAPEESV